MNILRPFPLVLVLVLMAPGLAGATSAASKASLLWLQGQAVDEVYDQSQAPSRDIRVQVWHGRDDDDPYRRGEPLEVSFRTNADMYVTVYRLDVDGRVEILWPTSRFDDGFVYGNHTYSLPRPGSPVRLTSSDRKGVEYVQAIASEYPFDLRDLGIDFRFDLDADVRYDYTVSGDPFLAVNDINFAITGLEEDVDYVVTDWTHLYVESKVEYARYSCTQCHQGEQGETYVHPYVDTCTTVNVYSDWNWHRSWYVSFGWYPLYYDAPYYYWDVAYARPYWFSYYPIYYSWYSYPVYVRPYPVYSWYDSPWYAGDYRVRYRNGVTRQGPLYDVTSPGTRERLRNASARSEANTVPPSIARATRSANRDSRVDQDRLVRNDAPSRERAELNPRAGSSTRNREVGVRDDRARSGQRRVTSLAPEGRTRGGQDVDRTDRSRIDGEQRERSTERRWTRPVIRNGGADRGSGRGSEGRSDDGSSVDRSRSNERGSGQVDSPRRRSESGESVDRPSSSSRDRSSPTPRVTPQRERSSSEPRVTPQRDRPKSEPRVTPQRERQRPEAAPAPRQQTERRGQVAPPRSSSNPDRGSKATPTPSRRESGGGAAKATPSRGGGSSNSGSRGGGSESRSRGNGGGGRG